MEKADLDQPGAKLDQPGAKSDTTLGLREEAPLPREAYALLAQANLLRMRGRWDDAAGKCMEALRLAPDSASANSLLGDIYENQGRYDDAAQWYRMALDANPDSPADRLKLDRLRRGEEYAPPEPAAGAARLQRDPELALRVGAIAAALGLVLMVALAYGVAHHAGALRALGLGGDPVVSAKPLVVAPTAGILPADPDGGGHDPSEQALLTTLRAAPEPARLGAVVYDVQVDPRVSRVSVTFGLPDAPGITQAQVAQAALRVLQAAAAGQAADTFTARCLLLTGSGPGKTAALAFAGDASRAALQAAPAAGGDGVPDPPALAAFTDVWWSATADVRA